VAGATLIGPTEPLTTQSGSLKPDPRGTYKCPKCEHILRASGLGRHRVYFELNDERTGSGRSFAIVALTSSSRYADELAERT
jgi:hypothetical protein